jgi:hypothetical protein
MMHQTKDGKYQEEGGLGGIHLQPGDWLRKFSAAIYHHRSTPKQPPVARIAFSAGETILGTAATLLSEQDERKFILAHLTAKHKLSCEHTVFIGKLCERVHRTSEFAQLAEALAQLLPKGLVEVLPNALLDVLDGAPEWRRAELFSMAGAVLFSAAGAIQMVNDWETAQRLIGMRGVAYGVTSWAFEQPAPPPPAWIGANSVPSSPRSPTVRKSLSNGIRSCVAQGKAGEDNEVELGVKAWNAGCKSAWREMEEKAARTKENKEKIRAMWRNLAGGERRQLAKIVMGNLDVRYLDEATPYVRAAFWSPAPTYPTT